MFPRLFRFVIFIALVGGMSTLTPTLASAEDAPNSRGAKKKKKKKKKTGWLKKKRKKGKKAKKARKGKKVKKGKKTRKRRKKTRKGKAAPPPPKSTDAPPPPPVPERGALAQSCISECKKAGKNAAYGGPCVTSCLDKIRSGAGKGKTTSCRSKCKRVKGKKKRKRCYKTCRNAKKSAPPPPPPSGKAPPPSPPSGKAPPPPPPSGKTKSGKGNVAGHCKTAAKTHCKKSRTNKGIYKCLSKLSKKARRKLSKSCMRSLKAHKSGDRYKRRKVRKLKKRKKFFANIFMPGAIKKTKVEYEIWDNLAVTGGDIILGDPKSLEARFGNMRVPGKVAKAIKKKGSRGGSVISRTDYLWPDATIPYLIGSSIHKNPAASDGIRKIREAAKHINSKTALRLKEISSASDAENYIEFMWSTDPDLCASSLGMQGGRQTIVCNYNRQIGTEFEVQYGTIVHEILHAAGFNHTMKRADSNKYITVHPNNTCLDQFEPAQNFYTQYCDGTSAVDTKGAYDYSSIMHYSSGQCCPLDSAGYCTAPSVTDKSGKEISTVHEELSAKDIVMIDEVYTQLPWTSKTVIELRCDLEGKAVGGKAVLGADGEWEAGADGYQNWDCQEKCGKANPFTSAGRAALRCRQACRK